jgi:prepilin-type N-terminal cleavage/methylation domain-containing protein
MKKIKGFTLVECIVAMTVFAIAALTMAQVYVTVANIQRENEFMQYSLANQMKYVENQTGTEAVRIGFEDTMPVGATPSGDPNTSIPPTAAVVKLYKVDFSGGNGVFDGLNYVDDVATEQEYTVGINMFILKSREGSSHDANIDITYEDATSTRAYTDESNTNLRYKFMTPY